MGADPSGLHVMGGGGGGPGSGGGGMGMPPGVVLSFGGGGEAPEDCPCGEPRSAWPWTNGEYYLQGKSGWVHVQWEAAKLKPGPFDSFSDDEIGDIYKAGHPVDGPPGSDDPVGDFLDGVSMVAGVAGMVAAAIGTGGAALIVAAALGALSTSSAAVSLGIDVANGSVNPGGAVKQAIGLLPWVGLAGRAVRGARATRRALSGRSKLSMQKQARHLKCDKWEARRGGGGGYFANHADAEAAFEAARKGRGRLLGYTSTGNPVVKVPGASGFNNNRGAGVFDQPTDVFIFKGSGSRVSVVPTSPKWGASK